MTMKNITVLYAIILLLLCSSRLSAQRTITASLDDIIAAAQEGSPDALVAQSRLVNSKWQNVAFYAGFKPQLRLNATLPDLNRQIDAINLPDGSVNFLNRSFMNSRVGISLFQVIRKTGGTVSIGSSLNRLDLFETNSQSYSRSYLSNPISLSFDQPLFQFNAYQWDRKENDLRYQSLQKQYTEQREMVAFQSVNNFFRLYVTKIELVNAKANLEYLDSLNTIAEGRYSVGRISETEMLQVKLGAKNASARVSSLELDVQMQTEELRDFLGISEEVSFDLVPPSDPPLYAIDKQQALDEANRNRSRTIEFRRRLLAAERDVEQARKSSGPNISLEGSLGLTQTSSGLSESYQNLLDQESIRLTLSVPIADWGLRKAQREIAKSNLELEQLQVSLDQNNFDREITVNINQLELKRKQLKLEKEALEVATLRLDIAKKRYQIGKTDVLDLNVAIQEHRSAIQQYYNALWSVWSAHYQIRNLTLYDFIDNRPIQYD